MMLCNASLAAGDACTHTAAAAAERVPGADVIVDGDHEDGGIALGEYLCWNKQILRRSSCFLCPDVRCVECLVVLDTTVRSKQFETV